jgi:hypothetical protein
VSSSIDVSELNTAIANNSDQSIIRSISNLEKLSSKRYNEIINDNRISTFELEFEKIEKDAPFIIQLYETNDTVSSINKLVCVDHGEIFSNEKNKFMQVFSFGKIFHTNIDVDIKYQLNNNSFKCL